MRETEAERQIIMTALLQVILCFESHFTILSFVNGLEATFLESCRLLAKCTLHFFQANNFHVRSIILYFFSCSFLNLYLPSEFKDHSVLYLITSKAIPV